MIKMSILVVSMIVLIGRLTEGGPCPSALLALARTRPSQNMRLEACAMGHEASSSPITMVILTCKMAILVIRPIKMIIFIILDSSKA